MPAGRVLRRGDGNIAAARNDFHGLIPVIRQHEMPFPIDEGRRARKYPLQDTFGLP